MRYSIGSILVPPFIETKKYIVNAPPLPDELEATISVDGWIQVPQEDNWLSPAGAFVPNGNMTEIITQSLAPFTPADETGVIAGGPRGAPARARRLFWARPGDLSQSMPSDLSKLTFEFSSVQGERAPTTHLPAGSSAPSGFPLRSLHSNVAASGSRRGFCLRAR